MYVDFWLRYLLKLSFCFIILRASIKSPCRSSARHSFFRNALNELRRMAESLPLANFQPQSNYLLIKNQEESHGNS